MKQRLLCHLLAVCAFALAAPLCGQPPPAALIPEAAAAQHVGKEATIAGKVFAITTSGKGTVFLNFGARFPKHTFSGVVFAGNKEAVGDLKEFEGKAVAVTGKVELSPDKKPQIIISKREQIRLVDPALLPAAPTMPAVPALVTPPPPSTATPPKPATPARKIALAPDWVGPSQGGELTRKDLATLFAAQARASAPADGAEEIRVFGEVRYLEPLAEARKRLQLEGSTPSRTRINCPGLPRGSFSAQTFAGVFLGGYTRLCLITDNDDQVVSALLIDETPRSRSTELTDLAGYHTYDFINQRTKATSDLVVRHEIVQGAPGVVVVESMLVDPKDGGDGTSQTRTTARPTNKSTPRPQRTGKVLERSRWFVPGPVVQLILRSVSGR